ncbi:MAG TPA: hypothetical protein VMH35_16245 [Streptosporangiaceae bacterium]|nr:hypothetical protein [Streptosporangiaceae bacterium]
MTGYFPGYRARPFPQLTDAQLAEYVAANTAAIRDVISWAEPDYALANHLVMGPAILARTLPGRVPYAVRVHRSALEETVMPHVWRFGGYARQGLARAHVVLVGSGHAAEELWEVMRQPDLPDLPGCSPRAPNSQHTVFAHQEIGGMEAYSRESVEMQSDNG